MNQWVECLVCEEAAVDVCVWCGEWFCEEHLEEHFHDRGDLA